MTFSNSFSTLPSPSPAACKPAMAFLSVYFGITCFLSPKPENAGERPTHRLQRGVSTFVGVLPIPAAGNTSVLKSRL